MTETPTRTAGADLAEKPFDELVGELQRIVQSLESGNLPLEESIGLYRHGLELHAACEARLREAELAITQLGRGAIADAAAETSGDVTGTTEPDA